jgi:hypothetical protein
MIKITVAIASAALALSACSKNEDAAGGVTAAKEEAVGEAAASNATGTVNDAAAETVSANDSAAAVQPTAPTQDRPLFDIDTQVASTTTTCEVFPMSGNYVLREWSRNKDREIVSYRWLPERRCSQAVQPTAPIPSYPPADYVAEHWTHGTHPKGCTAEGTIRQFNNDGSEYQSSLPCTVAP